MPPFYEGLPAEDKKRRVAEMSEAYETVERRLVMPSEADSAHVRRAFRAAESIAKGGFVLDVVVQHDDFLRAAVSEPDPEEWGRRAVKGKYPFLDLRPDAVGDWFAFDDAGATLDGTRDKVTFSESLRHLCARVDPSKLDVDVCTVDAGERLGLDKRLVCVEAVFRPDPDWSVVGFVPDPSDDKFPDGDYIVAFRAKTTRIAITVGSSVIGRGYYLPLSAHAGGAVSLIRSLKEK